jgi:two-component system phosphate regulon sensor histidine kinase PhoR
VSSCEFAEPELGSSDQFVPHASSFRSRAWPLALTTLLATAAVAVPLVLLSDKTTRLVVAGAAGLVAVVAGLLVGRRLRDEEESREEERLRTREELDEVEHRYRALVETLPLVTWLYEPGNRGSTFYVSPLIEGLVGYSPAEWVAEPDLFTRLLHPEDRERVLAEIARARKSETPVSAEYRLLARGGGVVWVREETSTVRSSTGEPLYTQTFIRDIGERKGAEEERERLLAAERSAATGTAERQARLDLIHEVGDIVASSVDYQAAIARAADLAVRDLADWCVVDVAEDGGPLTRLTVARAEPRRHEGGAAPAEEPEQEVREVVESGRPWIAPGLGERSDGTAARLGDVDARSVICVPIRARKQPLGALTLVRTGAGGPYGADDLALAQDLADRIALAVDRARLYGEVEERADAARVLAHVADGVLLLDRNGIVRQWNPAAAAITAIEAADVIGRPAAEVIPGWQEASDSVPVSSSPNPGHAEVVIPIETERGERWISISGVQFFGGTVYAFRDLTEMRHLEEVKADFIATASHELRTPLAAVYGAAQTLLRHDFALDEVGRDRFVSLIAEESERLGRIVNEILLANQLDAGRVDLEAEPFDAADLVERVVEATRAYAPPAVKLELNVPNDLPRVAADLDKVRQVLVNLVENAIKYSPDGGRVEVGAKPRGTNVCFYVKDEGLGIAPEEQSRVFEKFYRVDPHMMRGVGGTGLGLYICKELVSRMGGDIWVESNDGKGSTFLFELPATDASAVEGGERPAGGAVQAHSFRRRRS